MPGDTTDPNAYVTSAKAAAMLGLEEGLIEWALDRRILAGQRDAQGRWTISRSEIESGQRPLEEQFAYLSEPRKGDGAPTEPKAEGAGPAGKPKPDSGFSTAQPPTTRAESSEISRLTKRVDALLDAMAAKDALIDELARSLARMGEKALDRLPRPDGSSPDG